MRLTLSRVKRYGSMTRLRARGTMAVLKVSVFLRFGVCLVALTAMLAGCNQSIDLSALQMLSKAMDDQEPANAAIAADMYGSCERQLVLRETGLAEPSVQLATRAVSDRAQSMLQDAQAALDRAKRAVALAIARGEANRDKAKNAALRAQVRAAQSREEQAVAHLDSVQNSIRGSSIAAASATPTPHPSPSPLPSALPTPLLTPDQTNDPCQYSEDAAEQWQSVNLVLTNYVRTLSNLAGASDRNTAYGLDSLAKDVTNAGLLKNGQGDALKSAVAQLITERFNVSRREAIAQDATKADGALGRIIDILEYVARNDYRGELDGEQQTIDNFYRDNFYATQAGLPAMQALQFRAQWRADLDALAQRRHAIDAYVQSLEAIRKAHSAILRQIGAGGESAFASIIAAYVSEYTPLVESIRKAYVPAAKSP